MPTQEKDPVRTPEIQAAPRGGYGKTKVKREYLGPAPSAAPAKKKGYRYRDLTPREARRQGLEVAASAAADSASRGARRYSRLSEALASPYLGMEGILGTAERIPVAGQVVGMADPELAAKTLLYNLTTPPWKQKGPNAGTVVLPGETGMRALKEGRGGLRLTRGPTKRVLTHENLHVEIPHAKSLLGTQLEKAYDYALRKTNLMPGKVGQELGRQEHRHQAYERAISNRLRAVARRLKPDEHYALRLVGENTSAAERIAHHQASFENAPNVKQATLHAIHLDLIHEAAKYVERGPDGLMRLREDAPKRLTKAWGLIQRATDKREGIITSLGKAMDESLAARIENPGRILKGARWVPHEKLIRQELEASPARAEVHAWIDQHVKDPAEADAFKQTLDLQSLAFSQRHGIRDENGNVTAELAPDALYKKFAAAETHASPEELLGAVGDHALLQVDPRATHSAVTNALRGVDRSVFRKSELKPAQVARLIAQGEPGRFWYEDSAKAILHFSHGDKDLADKLAQLVAIYSSQREPVPNMQLAINAYNEWRTRGSIKSFGTASQISKANDVMKGIPWVGRKTDRFYANMLENIDPKKYAATFPGGEVTNDIWMARLFGLKTDTPSPREYAAMERIVQRIASRLGWKPKQVQAALWIAKKAQSEGTSIDQAGTNFAHALQLEHGVVPFEAAPGMATAPDLHELYMSLPKEKRVEYTRDKARAVEEFIDESGLLGRLGNEGPGVYEGQVNPGWSVYLAASRGKGKDFALQVAPHNKEILDGAASAIGEALNQDAAAWFKPFIRKNIPLQDHNGMKWVVGRNLTEEEALGLNEAFDSAGHDIAIVHESDGSYLLNFSSLKNRDFQRYVEQTVNEVHPGVGGKLVKFAFDGNYIERDAYAHHVRPKRGASGGRPDLVGGAALRLQERAAAVDRRYFGDGAAAGGRAPEALAQTYSEGALAGTPRGAFEPIADGRAVLHAVQGSAKLDTVAHEIAHGLRRFALTDYDERIAAKWAGAKGIKNSDGKTVGYNWTRAAEEKFARGYVTYLRDGRAPTGKLRTVFLTMTKALRDLVKRSDIEDLNPQVRDVFDRLSSYEEHQGDVLVGPEHEGATTYFKYERGAPIAVRHVASYVSAFQKTLFRGGRGRAIGAGPQYVEDLRKGFRGGLLFTANFKVDVARATADSLVKAARLGSAARTREALLKASTELPTSPHDIAIKEDPNPTGLSVEERAAVKKGERDFKAQSDELLGMAMGDKKVTEKSLERIEGNAIEKLRQDWFPEEIAGEHVSEIAARLSNHEGAEPIPNIRWVNHRLLDATGVFDVGAAKGQQLTAVRALIRGIDAFNDLQRATILFLAPKYIPMNLAGNLVMNLLQQGVFAIPNLAKAAALHWNMEPRLQALVDELMGHGFSSILESRGGHTVVTDRLAHAAGIVVDLIPRRAAFLHEARREGYRTLDALSSLLDAADRGEPWARDVVDQITYRANDAIIDYERMGPLEKNLIRRVIFFYPWVKGATRYSARFLVEHPIEAAALGFLAYEEQKQANQDLGPRPYYAQWLYKVGEEGGLPKVVNLQQAVPFTTPVDEAAAIYGTITGDRAFPSEFEQLTPAPSSLLEIGASYLPGMRDSRDAQGNLFDRAVRIVGKNTPMVTMYTNLNQTDADRARRVFPRTPGEELQRYMLGSLFAPEPFNAKKARESMHGQTAATPEQNAQDWEKKVEKATGSPVPRQILELKQEKETYQHDERGLKKQLGLDGTKVSDMSKSDHLKYEQGKYGLKIEILAARDPQTADALRASVEQAPDVDTLKVIGESVDTALGWDLVDEYSSDAGVGQ